MKPLLIIVLLLLGGCASMPMDESARDADGNRLPDISYQWTWSGVTKAVACRANTGVRVALVRMGAATAALLAKLTRG